MCSLLVTIVAQGFSCGRMIYSVTQEVARIVPIARTRISDELLGAVQSVLDAETEETVSRFARKAIEREVERRQEAACPA